MNSFILLILLQFRLFGSTGEPITNAKIYIENAASQETVAYIKVGNSGGFQFSNLDKGNYALYLEIPENTVKKVDKKNRQKFDTNIEVAYNMDKSTYLWQHSDGYLSLEFSIKKKLADTFVPVFEPSNNQETTTPETALDPNDVMGYILQKKAEAEQQASSGQNNKIKILQLTVIGDMGVLGGNIMSISQKDFHLLTVGKADITLENKGVVEVLSRFK